MPKPVKRQPLQCDPPLALARTDGAAGAHLRAVLLGYHPRSRHLAAAATIQIPYSPRVQQVAEKMIGAVLAALVAEIFPWQIPRVGEWDPAVQSSEGPLVQAQVHAALHDGSKIDGPQDLYYFLEHLLEMRIVRQGYSGSGTVAGGESGGCDHVQWLSRTSP